MEVDFFKYQLTMKSHYEVWFTHRNPGDDDVDIQMYYEVTDGCDIIEGAWNQMKATIIQDAKWSYPTLSNDHVVTVENYKDYFVIDSIKTAPRCWACREPFQPNQLAHMDPGGCMCEDDEISDEIGD